MVVICSVSGYLCGDRRFSHITGKDAISFYVTLKLDKNHPYFPDLFKMKVNSC